MIKFSRAGWNNIIIFAVLGFILLINATHDNVFYSPSTNESEQLLFGEHGVILTLTINQQIKIERIGKTWRATPTKITGQALEQMMLTWQQSIAITVNAPKNIDKQLALIVSVELAGQAMPAVLSLYAEDALLIFNHQSEQWFELPLPIYNQLLPAELFSE